MPIANCPDRMFKDQYGVVRYYLDGQLHRPDGPAIEWPNGEREWRRNGERHRLDGPAVEYDTCNFWYRDGRRHRLDGPAANYSNGDKEWYRDGKLHRLDGPAVEWAYGTRIEWWVEGNQIDCNSQEEFERLMKLKAFW